MSSQVMQILIGLELHQEDNWGTEILREKGVRDSADSRTQVPEDKEPIPF